MAVAPLRRGLPIDTPRERPPSPREVARWITTAPSRRGLHAAERLNRLLAHCQELDHTHDLVRQFAAMLDARDANALPDWLEKSYLPNLECPITWPPSPDVGEQATGRPTEQPVGPLGLYLADVFGIRSRDLRQ